jgi:hypothetical protein
MQGLFMLLFGLFGVFLSNNLSAQVFFPGEIGFILDKPCNAYTSFKKQTQPIALRPGETYIALGQNKHPGGSHAFLKIGGQRKWVDLSCGHYDKGRVNSVATSSSQAETKHECLPFFDDIDNPTPRKLGVGGHADITPPPPAIEAFGHAVNATCGSAGKVVSREEFKAMMRSHPDVLNRLKRFTKHRVFADRPARESMEHYLEDLTEAWFSVKAFDHIMCGEPKEGGKIGGLHFHGRYLQLQQSGEACRLKNYHRNEVVSGVIYSMGVRMRTAHGGYAVSPIKGYGLTLSAEDIMQVVTRAFSENPTSSNRSEGCLLPLSDDGYEFDTVFVRRNNGIRTFFPDATPNPDDFACKAAISL